MKLSEFLPGGVGLQLPVLVDKNLCDLARFLVLRIACGFGLMSGPCMGMSGSVNFVLSVAPTKRLRIST